MLDQSHVGRRVEYTDRSGRKRSGTIRGVIESTKFVDVALDEYTRKTNYLPFDTLRLIDTEENRDGN